MIQRALEALDRFVHWSEKDEDSKRSFLLIAGITSLVLVAIGAVLVGLYIDRIAFRAEPVLTVGDRKFSYAQLERRFNSEVGPLPPISAGQFGQLVGATLSLLEREELVRLAAEQEGITASEADVEAQMIDNVNLPDDSTREQLATRLRLELLDSGLRLDEFREISETTVLEERLLEQLANDLPEEAVQVDVRLLQVATLEEATEARSQLDEGEELAALAATLSIHSSRSSAGEIGWTPAGALPEEVEELAFSQEIGVISDVIETDEGSFIIEVRGKEVRELETDAVERVVQRSLALILEDIQITVGSEISLSGDHLNRLAGSIQSSSPVG